MLSRGFVRQAQNFAARDVRTENVEKKVWKEKKRVHDKGKSSQNPNHPLC